MKNSKNIAKIIGIGIVSIIVLSGMTSVSAVFTELFAGSKLEQVGNVHVQPIYGTPDQLRFEITTSGDWVILKSHAIVAGSLEDIPQTKKGNPKVGHFPEKIKTKDSTLVNPYSPFISLMVFSIISLPRIKLYLFRMVSASWRYLSALSNSPLAL